MFSLFPTHFIMNLHALYTTFLRSRRAFLCYLNVLLENVHFFRFLVRHEIDLWLGAVSDRWSLLLGYTFYSKFRLISKIIVLFQVLLREKSTVCTHKNGDRPYLVSLRPRSMHTYVQCAGPTCTCYLKSIIQCRFNPLSKRTFCTFEGVAPWAAKRATVVPIF